MIYELFRGHPLLASHQNALTMLGLPLVLCELLRRSLGYPGGLRVPSRRMLLALALLAAGFTVARNLPFQPFTALAPVDLPDATQR